MLFCLMIAQCGRRNKCKIEKYVEISTQFLEFVSNMHKHPKNKKWKIQNNNSKCKKNRCIIIHSISRERKKWPFISIIKSQET